MANHGAVAYGEDLWQAFDRLETLEHTAKIAILAKALGGANDLPQDAIEKLINIREKAGYLRRIARCQACGYLHDAGIACDLDVDYPTPQTATAESLIHARRTDRAFEPGGQIGLNYHILRISYRIQEQQLDARSIGNG